MSARNPSKALRASESCRDVIYVTVAVIGAIGEARNELTAWWRRPQIVSDGCPSIHNADATIAVRPSRANSVSDQRWATVPEPIPMLLVPTVSQPGSVGAARRFA